jgi:sulfur carrier protein
MNDVVVNGHPRALAAGTTLREVVASLTANAEGCAAAVNDSVVPRGEWDTRTVEPGDRIEVLTAVQGG